MDLKKVIESELEGLKKEIEAKLKKEMEEKLRKEMEEKLNKEKEEEKEKYICSITSLIMIDPVITADGHTYEREAIEEWLKKKDTSPKTGQVLSNKVLIPNWDKKKEIDAYLDKYPDLFNKDDVYFKEKWITDLKNIINNEQMDKLLEGLKPGNTSFKVSRKDTRFLTCDLGEGYTLFHLACKKGNVKMSYVILKKLLEENSLTEEKDLMEQAKKEKWDALLLKLKAFPESFELKYVNSVVLATVEEGDINATRFCKQLGADIEQKNSYGNLLHRMVQAKNVKGMKAILVCGIDPDTFYYDEDTALHMAVKSNFIAGISLLLEYKTNLNKRNAYRQTPIGTALLNGYSDALKLLVGIELAKLPPLHLAISLMDVSLIKALVEKDKEGTLLNALCPKKKTPLFTAIELQKGEFKDRDEIIKILLSNKTDTTIAYCEDKKTVLHRAVELKDLATIKLLLDQKLNPKVSELLDMRDKEGNTPLHLAISLGSEEIASILFGAGANVELLNNRSETAVSLAKGKLPKLAEFFGKSSSNFEKKLQDKLKELTNNFEAEEKKRREETENTIKKFEETCPEIVLYLANRRNQITERIDQIKKRIDYLQESLTKGEQKEKIEMVSLKNSEEFSKSAVDFLKILPNGKFLSGSPKYKDKSLKLWDSNFNLLQRMTLPKDMENFEELNILPSGMLVCTYGTHGVVVIDLTKNTAVRNLEQNIHSLKVLTDERLVGSTNFNTIMTLELKSGNWKTLVTKSVNSYVSISKLETLPSGEVVVGDDSGYIPIINEDAIS